MRHINPGSYIITARDEVLLLASQKLNAPMERLETHPDVHYIKGAEKLSLGIERIRFASMNLQMRPIIGEYKFLIIEDFHFATVDAQNAFLKTFEEPPEYAYIFLITPYIDRLLNTIVSRAQVLLEQSAISNQQSALPNKRNDLEEIMTLSIGERLLWLDKAVQEKEKTDAKQLYISIVDDFLTQGVALLRKKKLSLRTLEALKEAKWSIEQGFPLPKLLVERFLLLL